MCLPAKCRILQHQEAGIAGARSGQPHFQYGGRFWKICVCTCCNSVSNGNSFSWKLRLCSPVLPVHRFRFSCQVECNIVTGSDAFKTAAITWLNSRLLSGMSEHTLHTVRVFIANSYVLLRFEKSTEFQAESSESYASICQHVGEKKTLLIFY